jgi:hypothetical protein
VSACFACCYINLGKPNNGLEHIDDKCVATIKKRVLPPPPGTILNLTKYAYVDKTDMLAKIMTGGDGDIGNLQFFFCCSLLLLLIQIHFSMSIKVLSFSLQVCGESANLSR